MLAKNALNEQIDRNYQFVWLDLRAEVKKNIILNFEEKWNSVNPANKLKKVKPDIGPWYNLNKLNRKDSIVLSTLRLGHTNLTHCYLMDSSPPPAWNCGNILTVEHIFEDCNNNIASKNKYEILGLKSLANCKTESQNNIIKFMKELEYYNNI